MDRRAQPREERSSPFRANFLDLVRRAAEADASDMHVEPLGGEVRVRIRVDGTLRILQSLSDPHFMQRFLSEAKKACQFDMGKIGVPQDRRLRVDVVAFDLRASLIPTLYGEKIVLRLLQRGKAFSLDGYPMPAQAKADLRSALGRSQGLILITGPTGSGKTTLLYSALSSIDRDGDSVHTLEDPIEYELGGISQTSIGPEMSFADALRSLMRQDPDVIMVGEIRDGETAKAAIHAAATGHLVLSTIHANSAAESVRRLEDLGMSRDQVTSSLLYASAQRLVPRLCRECRELDGAGAGRLRAEHGLEIYPMHARGCEACHQTGVGGRVLLFEYLTFRPAAGSERRHVQHGTLREHALECLRRGEIDATNALGLD